MKQKTRNKKLILGVFCAIVFFFCMLVFLTKVNNVKPYENTMDINEEWTLQINHQVQQHVTLDQTTFSPAGKGDVVSFSCTIPENTYAAPMLRFWMCHSKIQVYVDDQCIYKFGESAYENNTLIGSGYHWVSLPQNSSGKCLKLVFTPGEDNAFTNLGKVLLSEAKDCYRDFISETFFNICAGLFLVIFGIGTILVSEIVACVSREYSAMVYTGIFSFLIGTWTLCNKGDVQLISDDFILNQYLEYYSIYLGVIPILLFLIEIRKEKKKGMDVAKGLAFANICLVALTTVLHFTKTVQFPMMIPVFHVFCAGAVLYIIVSCIYNIRKGQNEEQMILLGIGILAACFVFDILIFNVAKYFDGSLSKYMGITSFGGLAFVICMMVSFVKHVYRGISSKIEKEALLTMAYRDNLTKLSNQARYTQELLRIEQEKEEFYLIMFDLNELKKTNDSNGHSDGDMLLCCFANVLRNCFGEKGLVARIGGDEFAVILNQCSEEELKKLQIKYLKLMEEENQKGYSFQVSAAYGMSSNGEDGSISITETKKRADIRMYECKKSMKHSS